MAKLDPTVTTVIAAAVLAVASSATINYLMPNSLYTKANGSAHAADTATQRPLWAASATGRVEPREGEIRIVSQTSGKIEEVLAKVNDRVQAGDLLVRLDDDELKTKLLAAASEVAVREREREEEPVKGLEQERRDAGDLVAASERAVFRAQGELDEAYRLWKAGQGNEAQLRTARDQLKSATEKLEADRVALNKLESNPDMPKLSRLESSLIQARADVSLIENAIERTRIRAPSDGSVLTVWAKPGELAVIAPDMPLVLFGDVTSLRVRAEVEERDTPKIRPGQRVVVRADAYPDRDFEGVVTQLGQALGTPRITTRGPRRPNDVEVLEVLVSLDGTPPLLTGMRVDVFFRHETSASASQSPR